MQLPDNLWLSYIRDRRARDRQTDRRTDGRSVIRNVGTGRLKTFTASESHLLLAEIIQHEVASILEEYLVLDIALLKLNKCTKTVRRKQRGRY